MNIYKKWIILSLSICAFVVVSLSTLLYIYDPFQFYHKPYFRKETFLDNMRFQAKAIIDNYDFDSIIIGTSMLQNTSPKEAGDKLGGKWVNLSIPGAYADERAVILNYTFKKKKIKNIIYSLDAFLADKAENANKFEKIYNAENFFIPLGIYINVRKPKFLLCALTYSSKEKCVGKEVDLEKLMRWIDKDSHLFGGFEKWKKMTDYDKFLPRILSAKEFNPPKNVDIEKNKAILQEYLLSFVQENKDTNFYFVIPAYLKMTYKLENDKKGAQYYNKDSSMFSIYKAWLEYLILETGKYPNVKIYGFDDLDYADNIANYKDPTHYNIDMNSMQLDAIKNNTHILTPENMDKYFEIMEEKIRNYDLEPFVKQIEKDKMK